MPAATSCKQTFKEIAQFASSYEKAVQLQISMISTSDAYRKEITGNVASSIAEIAEAIRFWQKLNPLPQGRKPNINIIVTEEVPISAKEIYQVLPPGLARFRFRPYIPNQYGKSNRLSLVSTERYRSVRAEFLEAGYEVSAWGNPPETIWRFGLAANAELERYRERVKQDPGLML
jgi:hypothetical protein